MESTSFTRKINVSGGISIPIELLRSFGLNIGDSLKIYSEEDLVFFSKWDSKGVEGYYSVKKITPPNRFVLPKFFRNKLNLEKGDFLEFFIEKDRIIIKKF